MARTNHHHVNVLKPTSPGSSIKRRQTINPATLAVAVAVASPGKSTTTGGSSSSSTLKRRSASMTAVEISRHAAISTAEVYRDENEDGSSLSPRSEFLDVVLARGMTR